METGQRYPLGIEPLVIGQTRGNLNFSDDALLSNPHCQMVIAEGQLTLENLNDAATTLVNGKPLRGKAKTPLKRDDVLRLGQQELKIHEVSFKQRRPSRRSRHRAEKQKSGLNLTFVLIALALLAVALYLTKMTFPS